MAVKKLGDLTVEEATKELKKRGLDVNGDRNMLIARLRKALTEQRKPQTASVPTGSNQTEKTQPSPTAATTVDKTAVASVAAGAETVSQVPASSSTEKKEEAEEEKPPKAEVEPSAVVQPPLEAKEEKEGGGETPAEKKEEKEKVADDPPLDLLADESQNDLDDDIVCVSITPGRGLRKNEAGGSGKKQVAAAVQKDSPEKTMTTPSKDSNVASASAGTSEQDGSKSDLSLWVSGLESSSRAADLKTLFSNHGKVTGAKVVASAKTPDSKCFGIVTMATPDDVEKCIMALDGSSLHGKTITVELYSGHRKTVEKAMITPTATLWITGIAPETKAPELKKLFVPHGRVVAATIVMNASGGGTARRCGLVKMSSCEEADLCIQKVNKATLNDRVLTVERAKSNRLPIAKTPGKAVTRRPPALMSQKLPGSNKPSGSKPLSLLDPLLSVKGSMSKPSGVRPRFVDRGRTRRGVQVGGRMGRRNSSMAPPLGRMRMEREHVMMRIQHEQAVKAKEAELVRVLAIEFDRQKQKEEAERLAYEREQLEVERMRLDRERMEAERLRVQLEQERRQNEREQLERERARNQMLRNEQRMSMKRAAEQDESYWDYMMKKGRSSSPSSSGQNLGRGPNMYANTNQRLQQMAHGAERRLNESRMKNSMASGSSSSMGGRQMQGSSMYHRQSSGMESSGESGSKSEWKSLFNMSSGGSGNNGGEQSQWKSLSSSSLGRNNLNDDYSFSSSSSSFRGRPYPSNNSGGFGGMKSQYGSGFKGGRGGGGGGGGAHNRWR